jgi:hypothetical protein
MPAFPTLFRPTLRRATLLCASALLVSCASTPPTGPMGLFVTSVNPGKGADLGGLAGADAHCQKLATAAGAGKRTWRAYLSSSPALVTTPNEAVHARDRIGKGPWFNAKGVLIAADPDDLHGPRNNVTKATALTETGAVVPGRGDTPNNDHDILTGSRMDGTALSPTPNQTCGNWTLSGADGAAMTGHHDRIGPVAEPWAQSWNSSHVTRGCGLPQLRTTGGAGLFYCFATD